MRSDVRDGIPLPSRRAEGLMPFPVTDRRATITPNPSLLAAGTDVAEADTPDGVATYPSVIDAERDPLYGDGVKHGDLAARGLADRWQDSDEDGHLIAEHVRQSRLSRWQEQR